MKSTITFGDQFTLKDWGVLPTLGLSQADNFTCPHCQKFSFFCNGNFRRMAATIWRASTVGFSTARARDKDVVGIATLRCDECQQYFGVPLVHQVVEMYQADCPLWPKEEVVSGALF